LGKEKSQGGGHLTAGGGQKGLPEKGGTAVLPFWFGTGENEKREETKGGVQEEWKIRGIGGKPATKTTKGKGGNLLRSVFDIGVKKAKEQKKKKQGKGKCSTRCGGEGCIEQDCKGGRGSGGSRSACPRGKKVKKKRAKKLGTGSKR